MTKAVCTRNEAGGVMLFLNECCDRSPALRTDGKELYAAYLNHVKGEGKCRLDHETFGHVLDHDRIFSADGCFYGAALKP